MKSGRVKHVQFRCSGLFPIPFLVLFFLIACISAVAQSASDLGRSTGAPTNIYHGTDLENVDTGNGNLHISLPLLHLPGRGLDMDVVLNYNSKLWQSLWTPSSEPGILLPQVFIGMDQTLSSLGMTAPQGGPGWALGVPRMGIIIGQADECLNFSPSGNCVDDIFHDDFLANDGTRIALVNQSNGPPGDFWSFDGSYVLLTNAGLTYKDGVIANAPQPDPRQPSFQETLTDTDGNVISCAYNSTNGSASAVPARCTDTLNRTVTFTADATTGAVGSMAYLDSQGQSRTITFHYTTFSVNYLFNDPNNGRFCLLRVGSTGPIGFPVNMPLLTSVTLANGLSYQFQYFTNSDGSTTGEITKILLPTGGYYRYVYGFANVSSDTHINGCGLLQGVGQNRVVTNRYVSPDGTSASEQPWSYNFSGGGGNNSLVTTVTDPLRNSQVYTRSYGIPLPLEVDYKDPTGRVLKSVQGVVEGNGPSDGSYFYTSAIINNAAYQTMTTILSDSNQQSRVSYTYTPFNDVLSKDETDWGVGAPGALLRETNTTYEDQVNPAYLSAHILGLPASVAICSPLTAAESGAGVQGGDCPGNSSLKKRAETDTTYDEASFLTTYPGTLPPGTQVAPPNSVRGLPSTVRRWLNTNNSQITTHANWFTTGLPFQKIDALGNATTYTYSSNFAGAYPTQTCDALNHCVNQNYFLNTGLLASLTDPNSQTSGYTYDLMSRILQITYPAQVVNGTAIAGQSSFTYNDTPGAISIEAADQQDGANSITSFHFYDGLGRANQTQLNDPEGNVLKKTTFDALGRVSTSTNPYRSTSDPSYGVTQTQYDALGRITTVTRPDTATLVTTYSGSATQVQDEGNGRSHITRISQSDGLGRLISVCEITNATQANQNAPAACGQIIAGTGFLTTYQYDALSNLTGVQQGGVSRSFTYDSLSRLLSAANPESSTTTYTYDANGNVLTRVRPAPNQANPNSIVTTTYKYDTLNRPISITFSDGVTPSVAKHYDTSMELGVGLDNTIGRLSAEYVTSPSGQVLAGKVFGYDPMGRVINNSQCVPGTCSSSTALPVTYGYDLLGKPLTVTNGEGVTFGYSYDSAGRLMSMNSSLADNNHPGTLFSSATYNALGSLTRATVGNIVNEAMAYDCRGRVVSYGSVTLPGTATAPTVTASGCPNAAAMKLPLIPSEEKYAAFMGRSTWEQDLVHGDPLLWSRLGFGFREVTAGTAAGKTRTENFNGSRSNSILLSRTGKSDHREHGTIVITLNSAAGNKRVAPQIVSVAYGPRDSSERIARKLVKQFKTNQHGWARARIVRSGAGVVLEIVGRGRQDGSFVVSAAVSSNQPLPSLRATAIEGRSSPPRLLTNLRPGFSSRIGRDQ